MKDYLKGLNGLSRRIPNSFIWSFLQSVSHAKSVILLLIFQNIWRGWIVVLWVMLTLIMEQWLLGGKI